MPSLPTPSFQYTPLQTKSSTRLVSLYLPPNLEDDTNGAPLLQFSLKTVDLSTIPAYDCLSYTWGSPFAPNDPRNAAYTGAANSLPISMNGYIFHIGRNLYEFFLQMHQAIANVNKRSGPDGKTRLMHAAERGDYAQAGFLLRKGADGGARDAYGATALHRAAGQGHADVVLLLFSYGADATLQDALGRTPRDWAVGREGKLRVLDFEPPEGFAQTVYYLDHLDDVRASMGPGVVEQTLTACRPMWIDAISINQEDTQERNSQVAIMSDIYSRAESVIVWLGVEDEYIKPAYMLLEEGPHSDGVREWVDRLTSLSMIGDGLYEPPVDKKKPGWKFSAKHKSIALMQLLDRNWWRRVWIIQEFALARDIHMFSGTVELNWRALFLTLHNATLPNKDGSDSWLEQLLESAHREHISGLEAYLLMDMRLRSTKAKCATYLQQQRPQGQGRRLSLQSLGSMSWCFNASDPRDKVFALLALASQTNTNTTPIIADYSTPTSDLFIHYARLFMQGAQGEPMRILQNSTDQALEPLEGLSHVQVHPTAHPNFRDYKSLLPSWTPNFSIPLSTQRIWTRHLHAASTTKPNAQLLLPTPDPRILRVKGFAWDEVVAVDADSAGGHNGEHAGFGHNVPLGWLGLLLQMPSTYVTGRCSRLEALWRTLQVNHTAKITRDKNKHNKPTPVIIIEEFGKHQRAEFKEYLTRELRHYQDDPRLERWLGKLRTPDTSNVIPSLAEIREMEKGYEEAGMVFMKSDRFFEHRFKRYFFSRTLFLTRGGYLGLGPATTKPGDEVWLVAGARTPFVMRGVPRDKGKGRAVDRDRHGGKQGPEPVGAVVEQIVEDGGVCRRFVGESYVHGIMDGEAFRGFEGLVHPVSLV